MRSPPRWPRSPSGFSCHAFVARLATLAVLALAPVSSCGSPPAPEAPVAPAQPAPAATAVVQVAPPDVSEVPAPATLVLTWRFARPAASLGVVRGWSQLPLVQGEEIAELLAGSDLGPIVDLDAPVDFAVAVEGEGLEMRPLIAVSAGVRDPESARASLGQKYTLVPAPNGVLRIQSQGVQTPSSDDDDAGDDSGAKRTCELAPAFGAPSTRIVCGEGSMASIALRELGPWLTRTAPRAPSPDDLSADVRMKPLRRTLEGFRGMGGAAVAGLFGSRSAGDAAAALVSDALDFALDLDAATLRIDLADAQATLRSTLQFSTTSSSLTRMVLAHADGGTAPPRTFWQLPPDANLAFYERGIDAPGIEKLTHALTQLADKALDEAGLKDADRKALLSPLTKLPWTAPMAYASGLDPAAIDAAFSAAKDPTGFPDAETIIARELTGWRVMELDEPPAPILAALSELSRALARPGVARFLGGATSVASPTFRHAALPRGIALPARSQHFVLELHSTRSTSPPRVTAWGIHLILVPDGPRSWIGIGGDAPMVASKLMASIAAPGDARAELAPLDHDKVGAAGFLNVRAVPEGIVQLVAIDADSNQEAFAWLRSLRSLPHRGLTPVVYSFTASPGDLAAFALHLPRGAIEDAIVFFTSLSP
jgi:hypothetical protein